MTKSVDSFDDYYEDYSYDSEDEFHAVFTVQLGELIHDKVIDLMDGSFKVQGNGAPIQWYNDEQYERFSQGYISHSP